MDQSALSSRAIIGAYYRRLEQNTGAAWVDRISNLFTSDQESETYKWLGMSPAMREWIGGRQAKGLRDNGITITNKHYEATLELAVRDMRRDKTSQIMVRVNDLADRTNAHWASLLSTLILNGAATVCYDGQFYFDTDHTEGANTTNQSNKVTVDISTLGCSVHGADKDHPSVEEMQQSILQAVQAILSFKDDQNEPMNEAAKEFLVMVPTSLWTTAEAAVQANLLANAVNLIPTLRNVSISVEMNARLNTWTDTFVVFRTDSSVKALIRQEEVAVQIKAKAEGSDFEFDNDAHQYGVDAWRNVGYGYWQHACQIVMT